MNRVLDCEVKLWLVVQIVSKQARVDWHDVTDRITCRDEGSSALRIISYV